MADQMLLLAVGVSVGLILVLFLGILSYYLCVLRRSRSHYQELTSTYTVAPFPECTAPVLLVSPVPCNRPTEVPFTLPPSFKPRHHGNPKDGQKEEDEEGGMEDEGYRDILAKRGSLSVRSWYPVGTVLSGLYCVSTVSEVVAPPPGMATRLCFSVEYRHGAQQLLVSLLRLANLPPRFHGNGTLVELRLLPDDRRPRQVKARGTGPDPEFNDCCLFQVSGVSVCHSTLSVCVLSVERGGQRHAVGRVLFPMEGELCPAGRVLWRDLETELHTQCSELGDVQISLNYSPALQRLTVVILRARGLQLLTEAGVCVRVCLQIHTQVVKSKQSSVVRGGGADPSFDHKMTFKLRPQQLDEACLRVELQQPDAIHTEPPGMLGVVVLGPFMYSRGQQLQHWMDTMNTPQQLLTHWHGLTRST